VQPPDRIGLIGDVHTEDERLARALELFVSIDCDAVLCVGDVVDGQGDAARCCRLLSEARVATVRGNHDRWILAGSARDLPDATPLEALPREAVHFLASLPPTMELRTAAGGLLLCHGLGGDDMALLKPDDHGYAIQVNDRLQELVGAGRCRHVVCGHSHVRMVRHFGDVTFINPGTLLRDRRPGVAVVDFDEGVVQFHDITPAAVRDAGAVPLEGPDWPGT
jgi:putative phosphoesterase